MLVRRWTTARESVGGLFEWFFEWLQFYSERSRSSSLLDSTHQTEKIIILSISTELEIPVYVSIALARKLEQRKMFHAKERNFYD